MIILDTTATLQVTAGAGTTSLPVQVYYVDLTGQNVASLVNPNPQWTPITSPGTYQVCAAAPATTPTTRRSVQYIQVYNGGPAAVSLLVFIQTPAGSFPEPAPAVLLPGYSAIYNEDSGWDTVDTQGRRLVNAVFFGTVGPTAISAGTELASTGTVVFSNSNNVSFGMSGSSVVTAVAAVNVSAGTTSQNLSAVTFGDANGVSFGLVGSTVTASVAAGAAAGTVFAFSQDADFVTNFPVSQAAASFQKLSLPMNLSATQLAIMAAVSATASGALTVSHAVYTMSGTLASLASSASRALSWAAGTATTASSVYGGASGTRYRTLPVDYAMTPGDYLFAWALSTENAASVRVFGRAGLNVVGTFDGVELTQFLPGTSVGTVSALPVSLAATDTGYARTGFSALLQPGAILFGTH